MFAVRQIPPIDSLTYMPVWLSDFDGNRPPRPGVDVPNCRRPRGRGRRDEGIDASSTLTGRDFIAAGAATSQPPSRRQAGSIRPDTAAAGVFPGSFRPDARHQHRANR